MKILIIVFPGLIVSDNWYCLDFVGWIAPCSVFKMFCLVAKKGQRHLGQQVIIATNKIITLNAIA